MRAGVLEVKELSVPGLPFLGLSSFTPREDSSLTQNPCFPS